MQHLKNQDIRFMARCVGVPMWRVAKEIGCSEPTIIRWLREELPPEKRKLIIHAINDLAGGDADGNN